MELIDYLCWYSFGIFISLTNFNFIFIIVKFIIELVVISFIMKLYQEKAFKPQLNPSFINQ